MLWLATEPETFKKFKSKKVALNSPLFLPLAMLNYKQIHIYIQQEERLLAVSSCLAAESRSMFG